MPDVLQPIAGIDQAQARVGLDQQAMATQRASLEHGGRTAVHETAAEWTVADAVEVMDSHGGRQGGKTDPMGVARDVPTCRPASIKLNISFIVLMISVGG